MDEKYNLEGPGATDPCRVRRQIREGQRGEDTLRIA